MIHQTGKNVNNEKLNDFFAHLWRGGGWRFAQAIGADNFRQTHWLPPDAPLGYPKHWNGKANIFFGVNPAAAPVLDRDRAKYPGKADAWIMPRVASKNESICALNALISEFDGKDFTYPTTDEIAAAYIIVEKQAMVDLANGKLSKALPEKTLQAMAKNHAQNTKYSTDPDLYKARALAHIKTLPIPPSVTVASGGGYQCYWLLTDTFHIATEEQRTIAIDAQRRFTVAMGGDQSVKDLRRVLRFPGTMNVKPKYAPNYPTADFVWCEMERTYTLPELLAVCPEAPQKTTAQPKREPTHRTPHERTDPPTDDNELLKGFVWWVACAYNKAHKIDDELLRVGYSDHGERFSRPGEPDSKGVIVDRGANTSFHFSGNDPLYGDHRRRPFDVAVLFDYNGDYDAGADALGAAIGLYRPEVVAATIAYCRKIVVDADWSTIVPLDRQSAIGYMTGDTDRKLFDNLLDIMARAGKIANVTVSYRQLITATNADGVKVAIASVQTAKNFLDRLTGALLTYTPNEKGTVISLLSVVNTLDTSENNREYGEVSKVLTTGLYTSHKADDAFARGTARWAREVIEAEKRRLTADNPAYAAASIAYKKALASKPMSMAEMSQLIGAEHLANYRDLLTSAAADFLPGLGTYGLLVIADLLDNPHSTRKEIAERRGLKVSAVANVLRKFDAWELVTVEQADTFGAPKHYVLVGDVFGEIEAKLPEAKTYRIGIQRLDRRLESAQVWAQRTADDESKSEEERAFAAKRVNRIANQRCATVAIFHPELSREEIAKHIITPAFVAKPKPAQAPTMPEPGALAWQRLYELTGKETLSADEYGELQQLDRTLGAGVTMPAWDRTYA